MHSPICPHEKQRIPFISSSPSPLENSETLMGSSATASSSIDGVLDIALHHARNIHNICIYGNQDVFAKFSIMQTQDAVYSTPPVRAGGRNPVFNQSLQVMISNSDAVLKCEIWMMSCVRTYLQDQLLGFVLVPLHDLLGKGRVTKDYSLSSTELFHTPAGFVCLSLTFYLHGTDIPLYAALSSASCVSAITDLHHVEDNGTHTVRGNEAAHEGDTDKAHDDTVMNGMTHVEYDSIEFPDLHDPCENHHLVSAYLNMVSGTDTHMHEEACSNADQSDQLRKHVNEGGLSGAPFLQLGRSPMYSLEVVEPQGEGARTGDWSESPSCTSVLQEDVDAVSSRDASDSPKAKEVQLLDSATILSVEVSTHTLNPLLSPVRTMPRKGPSLPVIVSSSHGQESQSSVHAPPVTVSLEPNDPLMQQQIVDMYMKSMQQFSESLAKMKLPLDLENAHSQQVEVSKEPRAQTEEPATTEPTRKDGHRHFYGSRAFF